MKKIRNVVIAFTVMVIVLVGAGVGYTWYSGQSTVANLPPVTVPAPKKLNQEITHKKLADDAKVGVSIQTITSPVTPGSNASVIIKTNPKAICKISVVYRDIISKDSGLTDKTADEFGTVTWAWTVEPSVPIGTWPVKITCASTKHSGVVQGDLAVTRSLSP